MKEIHIFLISSKFVENRYDEDDKKEFEIVENHHIYGSVKLNKEIKGTLLDDSLSIRLTSYVDRIIDNKSPLKSLMPEIYKTCSNFVSNYGAKVEAVEIGHDKSIDIGCIKGSYLKVDSAKFEPKTQECTL